MNGIVLINKPSGVTSFSVTSAVRRKLGVKKAGHAGTLDPLASGVLPVYTGSATRFIDLDKDAKKRYTAGFLLGQTSDTLDCTGEILSNSDVDVSRQDIERLLCEFTGVIKQTPPAYSAIKQNGVPLYKLARQGITPEVKSREITVFSVELLEFDGAKGILDVLCSKGTYIRTLIADIGDRLGCGALMSSLERTQSSGFDISQCVDLEEFLQGDKDEFVHPADFAVMNYPSADISLPQERLFRNGGGLFAARMKLHGDGEYFRVYSENGFVGLGKKDKEQGLVLPKCIMN